MAGAAQNGSSVLKYCPRCGHPGVGQPSPKQIQCPACKFCLYLNVDAAVVALIVHQGRLLATRRKYAPAAGTWDLPGGFVDPGETARQALTREIFEELNLKITSAEFFCSLPNRYPYDGVEYRTLDLAFICRVENVNALQVGDDVADYCWMLPGQMNPEKFGLVSIRTLVARYRCQGEVYEKA